MEQAPTPEPFGQRESTPRTFAEALRRERAVRGWTQGMLAEHAGLSMKGVYDLERGRSTPRRHTLARLADALELQGEERARFLATAPPVRRVTPSIWSKPVLLRAVATRAFPSGVVTFLYTDMEGSTRLLQRLGDAYDDVLETHHRLLRDAFDRYDGFEIESRGDSFFVAFSTTQDALGAALDGQRALARHTWPDGADIRVRMGIHTGAPRIAGGSYAGLDVHRAARIGAAAHGGQILISSQAAELARGAPDGLPDGVTLRDLGSHRLKDLLSPERLWQVMAPDFPVVFPPPRTLDRCANNLPTQTTGLLGRSRELADLRRLVREGAWLVTLTGPAGVGKTRLSFQAAAELAVAQHADEPLFPDGVWLVRLSRVSDPALALSAVAHELGLREGGARPIREILQDFLVDKRLLLVIDNFEHVSAAAVEFGALCNACPGVQALVTSRSPLSLRGEREYALATLPTPHGRGVARGAPGPKSFQHIAECPSVALFTERARAVRADFELTPANAPAVAAICARLDGLPLALELAAARIKALPPEALLARLEPALPLLTGGPRDTEERQQTMRAALAWSESLLTPVEQAFFRRMSVFYGGADLAAIEAVCVHPEGAASLDLDALGGLTALLSQSLAHPRMDGDAGETTGEPRYGLLHVVREYGQERLEASGEAEALRRAHAFHLLHLAEEAPAPTGYSAYAWLKRMEIEQDNLRVALEWALRHDEVELGLRLGVGASQLWYARGSWRESQHWNERLVAMADKSRVDASAGAQDARSRAFAWEIYYTANCASNLGDLPAARRLQQRALDQARATGDEGLMALITFGLAGSTHPIDPEAASRLLDEALALARHSENAAVLCTVLSEMSWLYDYSQRYNEAHALVNEGLTLARRLGDRGAESSAHGVLATLLAFQGDMAGAIDSACRCLECAAESEFYSNVPLALDALATLAAFTGAAEASARLRGASSQWYERIGQYPRAKNLNTRPATIERVRSALGEARWADEHAHGRAYSLDEALDEARALAGEQQ